MPVELGVGTIHFGAPIEVEAQIVNLLGSLPLNQDRSILACGCKRDEVYGCGGGILLIPHRVKPGTTVITGIILVVV